jgi:formate dehydrogenase subunit beta
VPAERARIASRLARKPMGVRWAAVLRSCEIRAWVELVKLKQARTDEVILVSIDCLGAFQNKDYLRLAGESAAAATEEFVRKALAGERFEPDLSPACLACEFPVPPRSDIHIGILGSDGPLTVEARSGRPRGSRGPEARAVRDTGLTGGGFGRTGGPAGRPPR